MELTTRLGGSIEYWLARPFAFALWTYRHLQELDRREIWVNRMQRIEKATLIALAFHQPGKLADEQRAAIAEAGPASETDDLMEFGRRMAAELDAGKVMD